MPFSIGLCSSALYYAFLYWIMVIYIASCFSVLDCVLLPEAKLNYAVNDLKAVGL